MPLQFVNYREIAFTQLLGMLRTPYQAIMNYYNNLFLSAKFVLSGDKEKIRYLDKEIRRIELMVGIRKTSESERLKKELIKIQQNKNELVKSQKDMKDSLVNAPEENKEMLESLELLEKDIKKLDEEEYKILFKLEPVMKLKEIETYMDNDQDLKSYFKENGIKVRQLTVNSELDQLKNWVYAQAIELMPHIRFTKWI